MRRSGMCASRRLQDVAASRQARNRPRGTDLERLWPQSGRADRPSQRREPGSQTLPRRCMRCVRTLRAAHRHYRADAGRAGKEERKGSVVSGQSSVPRPPGGRVPAAYHALVVAAAITQMGWYRVSSGVPAGSGVAGRAGALQPAMVLAQARACAVSVTPGNSRRSSATADSSPRCSKAARIAVASASVTTKHAGRMGVRTAGGKRPSWLRRNGPAVWHRKRYRPPRDRRRPRHEPGRSRLLRSLRRLRDV